MRILGARVTHVWTDNPEDAPKIAAASKIENVVSKPEDVIGKVDAVIIGTDDGHEHVRRSRAFFEAGLPVFVDKPLAINVPNLNQFIRWYNEGKVYLSSSNMRYAPETKMVMRQKAQLGELRWIASATCKTWERYAIHALEAIWPVLGPGFLGVRTESRKDSDVGYITHKSGTQVNFGVFFDTVASAKSMRDAAGNWASPAPRFDRSQVSARGDSARITAMAPSGITKKSGFMAASRC